MLIYILIALLIVAVGGLALWAMLQPWGTFVPLLIAVTMFSVPAIANAEDSDYYRPLKPGQSWTVPGTGSFSDVHCMDRRGNYYTQRGRSWYLPGGRRIATYRDRTFHSLARSRSIACAAWLDR